MANVSPGVYTKIIDLSTFVQAVPSSIGFLCGLTRKGRDNELLFIGSRADYVNEFGEPNIVDYGKNYGQGPYIAYNFLGESGALYWIRALPDDATYANFRIDSSLAVADATASISITWIPNIQTKTEIQSDLTPVGDNKPICFLYPIGRGDYYNAIGVRLTEYANPLVNDVYVLDIYEKQSDGDNVIIESFNVSFDPEAKDNSGDSIWIEYVLSVYSSVLRAEMILPDESYTSGYDLVVKTFDKEIGTVVVDLTASSATISDNKQDFSDWRTTPETGNSKYVVIAKDGKGNTIWGWLGNSSGLDNETINVFMDRNLTGGIQSWNGDTANFDIGSTIIYQVKKSYTDIASAFISSEPVPLRKGSEGSLRTATGDVDTANAENLLQQAYSGIIDDSILDPETIYYSLVFDAGYPADVKSAISTLVQTRRDCVAIMDNGDNATPSAAIAARENVNTFNNFYVALYESYNKVADVFTGQDVWFSPVYHMSYIIPRSDNVSEIWFAAAGFNRAAIDTIKELRYNPLLGDRDRLYLKQLNPIVKFSQGYVVWGQLTSQAKPSALQDLNIVRLVLYCKRALEQYCRFFIFEQNDSVTWGEVAGDIVQFLEQIKTRRGLDSYSVDVGATDYEVKTKKFHVNITLNPTRVVEQIQLNFFIV